MVHPLPLPVAAIRADIPRTYFLDFKGADRGNQDIENISVPDLSPSPPPEEHRSRHEMDGELR